MLSSKKHLLNHASIEDIMLMLNLMKPKYYMPVIGEYRHMVANADIASSMGMPKENIIFQFLVNIDIWFVMQMLHIVWIFQERILY